MYHVYRYFLSVSLTVPITLAVVLSAQECKGLLGGDWWSKFAREFLFSGLVYSFLVLAAVGAGELIATCILD